jgi:uncharacterized protein
MRIQVLALACAGSLFAAVGPAAAQTPGTLPPPSISVTGEGQVSVAPDLATVDAGVTTDGKTAREAAEANNKLMGAVLLALKGLNIADKDVRTSRLSLLPQNAPSRVSSNGAAIGPMQIVGYRASNHVTVTLHDVTGIAATIDALVGAGANDIGGISFTVSDSSKLLDDARAKAMLDAQRKAEIYARAANVTLGPPLSITEEGSQAPWPRPMMKAMAAAPMAPTPVAIGEETLHVNVAVTYAIK